MKFELNATAILMEHYFYRGVEIFLESPLSIFNIRIYRRCLLCCLVLSRRAPLFYESLHLSNRERLLDYLSGEPPLLLYILERKKGARMAHRDLLTLDHLLNIYRELEQAKDIGYRRSIFTDSASYLLLR